MAKIRNRLAGAAASLVLACIGAATAFPAHASVEPSLEVCNSVNSIGSIKVWSTSGGAPNFPWALGRGDCHTFPGQSSVRVDVDPEWGFPDVDSYYIGVEGEGYGPCHDSENNASDPPNVSPKYVKYNTNAGHC